MFPNQQQPYQPGQVIQPQPQQPAQQPGALDFTQQTPPQQQPVQPTAPQAPAFDPNQFKQEVIDGVKAVLQPQQQPTAQPQQPQQQQNQPQYFNKDYNDWGVLEQDTKKLVADVVQEQLTQQQQEQQQAQQQAAEQDQKNQQIIDTTLTQLRGVGYLPPVTNQFDPNDPGKQAEQELIGYAVYLGTTDLAKAAQELKFKHDSGLKYDYQSKQFVQTGMPQQDGSGSIFGANLPVTPDGQPPVQQPYPQQPMMPQPQMYPQPYGPQNPYMPRPQYPAGFNAPVSNGGSYMGVGMQGQVPNTATLRHNSYDTLVDMFNRTQ